MKKASPFLVILILAFGSSWAQEKPYQYSFADSIRILLENTKNVDAATVGDGFSTVFPTLGPDQQQIIRTQSKLMKRKLWKLRPGFVNYFGAIVNAVNLEKADPSQISSWLMVAGKVIAKESATKSNDFFSHSRDFFGSHSLNVTKFYRLHALQDTYTFDFITPKIFVPDTSQNNVTTTPAQDSIAALIPQYMVPANQPELTGPVIRFSSVTLNFATSYDSTQIENTQGIFSLRDMIFVGQGGRFNWTSAGLSSDSVYYEFSKYNFKTASPYLRAGQGTLTYKGRLPGVVKGVFEFKSVQHKDKNKATYPRFASYESNIAVLGLGSERLKYSGGFGLQGAHPNSASVSGAPSVITMQGETDRKFKVEAKLFDFRDSLVTSADAKITIYQGNDSITHPAAYVGFDLGKEILTVIKNKSALGKAPFNSSFFNVDFSADQLVWPLKSDSLNIFNPGSGKIAPVVIESIDFYDPEDYRLLQGQGFRFHPLVFVVNYARKNGQNDFFVFDLAAKYNINEVKTAMEFLSQKGMIDYDSKTGKIHVKDKALHFVESMQGKTDYDNLKIHSLANKTANATINFSKHYMTVRGVDEFKLSDSLNVVIKPDSSIITLLQNRDIKFNGTITAGNFEITGKNFTLKYDSFFINLKHIDSIRFYVTEKDGSRRRVNNSMVGADSTAAAAGGLAAGSNKTSATLFINDPTNKSGRKNIPNYPRLDATAGGVIYFDRPEVLNGAYDRSVFFVIPPFKLDSLSDADPASINFEGTFISSGMLPAFKEKLHTMPDKSLGFTHNASADGYQLFKGDGKLFGAINLDNSGIRSIGKIEYLAATVESKDFIFYPDSVVGKGNIGSIKEEQFGNVYFPEVTLPEFKMRWLPKQDKMNLRNLRDPFALYKSSASLNGRLTVSKTGLTGAGTLNTRGSDVVSRDFKFTSKDFGARHAKFQVKTENPDKPALGGNDIRLSFDLEKNVATISPEVEGTAAISFPYAQFKTSIPKAVWDLNTQKIVMTKAPGVPLENSYFYTTRKELDSLNFLAERGEYDIKTQQLKVSGIPYIVVADAKITPENNEVLILENAKIGQLKNTTIVLDTINGYHRLTKGVVDIISRKEFSGYATYQYVNAVNDTFAIKMTDFHLEAIGEVAKNKNKDKLIATQQTVANGAVIDKDNVLIGPRIFYKGDMTMYATLPALKLKGYVKLDLKKIKNYDTWLVYEQSGDEKEIYLDFDKSVTEQGRRAEAGLHFGSDNSLYITFISEKKNPEDDDFFLPSGSLYFDSGVFKIEDRAKAAGTKLSGKVFNYNEEKQEVRFEGPVNFFKGLSNFNLIASALGSGNLETNDIKMNSFIMVDMDLPIAAYQAIGTNLQEIIKQEGATDGLGDQTELLYKIANIVGERTVKDYEQRSLQGYVPLSSIPELNKPLVFSVVNLKYNQKAKAFYSEGTLGVSNVSKLDVNGAFEGFMEIRKNEDGSPVFHVFFKASPESWYYFGYEDNRLMVQSSNPQLNDIINKKTNAAKAKPGEVVFIPGTDEDVLSFINRFRKSYYGRDDSYELTAPTASSEKKDDKKKEVKDDGF